MFCMGFLTVSLISNAADLSHLNQEYSAAEQEKQQIQETLDEQQEVLEEQQNELAAVEKEKAEQMSEKDDLILQMEAIFDSLQQIDTTIAEAEAEYNEKVALLKERAIAMYQLSNYSETQMFVKSGSMLDFLNRKSYYNAMLERDQQLIEEAAALKENLKTKKKIQTEQHTTYEELLAEKEAAISKLKADEEYLDVLSSGTKAMIDKLEELEAEMEAESERIAEMIRQNGGTVSSDSSSDSQYSSYTGGKLLWPAPASKYISSYFGMRLHPIYGYYRMHNGIDIAAAGGTNILAAEEGKVIESTYNSGYGNYIVVDHGNGYSTLYAHASKRIAKVGDYVSRGQVIALVGTTGNSTGNHLHFEVRIDGNPVNPLTYL